MYAVCNAFVYFCKATQYRLKTAYCIILISHSISVFMHDLCSFVKHSDFSAARCPTKGGRGVRDV